MFGYRRRHNDALRGIEDDPQESMSFSRDGSSSSCSSLVRELEIKMSKSDRSIIVWQAQRKGICTRSYGGSKQYIRQEFFRCKTCGHSEGLGVCVVCKDRCHRGHVLEAKGFTSSYCDCGTISSTSQGCSCFETWDQKFCTFAHKSSSHARQHAPATVSPLSPSSPSSQSSSSSSSSEMPLSASSRINQRDRPTASDPPGGKMPLRVGMRKTFLSVIHSSKTNEETPSPIIRKLLAEQEKKQAGEEEPTGRGAQQRAIDGTSITSKPQTAAATMATPRWKVAYEADTLIHRPLQRQHPSLSSSPWFESLRAGGSNDDGKTSPLPTTLNLGVASSSAAAAAGEEGGLRLTGSRVYQPFRHFRNGEGEGWRGGDGREANRSKGYSSLNGGEHDQKRRVVFMAPEARNQGRTSSPQYTDEKEVPNHSHANDMKQRRDDDDKTGATNTSAPPQPERVNSRCEAYDTLRADDYLDENVKLSLSSSAAEEERKYPPPLSLAPDFKGSGGRQSVPPPPPLNLPPPPQSLLQRQRGRRRVSAPITYMEEKRAQARAQRARRRNGTTDSSSTSSSSSSGGGSGDLEKVRRLLGRYGLCIGNTVERPAGDEGLGAMQGKWTVFVRASNKSCQPLKKYVSSVRFTFQGRSVSLSSRFHRNFAISRFGSRKMNITVKIFFKSHLRIPPMRHVHRLGGFQNEAAAGKPLSSSAFSSPFNSNSVGGRTYEHKTTVYPDLKSEFTRVVSSSSSSSRGSSSHLTTKISPPIAAQSGSSPSPSPVFNKLSPEDISTLTQHLSERLQVASSGGGHRGQPRRMVRAYSDGMVVEERRGMKAERKNGKEKNKTNRFKWTIDLHGVKGAREEGEDEETGARDRKDWNRPFQTAIHQGGYSNLHQLFVDFVSMARMYARVIVREQEVRDSEKTVRPLDRVGGLAGGRKYLVNGILFKLCGDPRLKQGGRWLYGGTSPSYECAAKSAGHEIKGANSYMRVLEEGSDAEVAVPFQVMLDYAGFRMIAMPYLRLDRRFRMATAAAAAAGAVAPKEPRAGMKRESTASPPSLGPLPPSNRSSRRNHDGDKDSGHRHSSSSSGDSSSRWKWSSLVYGYDADAGVVLDGTTATRDASGGVRGGAVNGTTIRAALKALARRLHLAEHTVQGKRIFTAADVEFHLGKDGRLYALDLARAFPPECAWVASHLPRNGRQSEFFRIMRPELLAHIAKNGITPPLSPDVFTGFSRGSPLEEALRLERGAEEATRYLVSVIIPGLAARIEEGTTVRLSEPVSSVLHREGINCRHIGLLRAHLRRNLQARKTLLVEIVTRTLKCLLRKRLREGGSTSEFSLQRRTVRFFNLVVNSERFWQTKVYEGIIRRFGKVALQEARVPTDSKTHGDEAGGGGGAAADDDIAATTAAAEADDPRGQSDDKGRKGTFFLSKKRLRSRCRPLLVRIIVYLVESARIRPTAEALKDFKEAVGGGGGGRKAANEGGDESDGGSRSSRSKDGRPPFSDGNDGAHNSVVVDEKGREEVFVFHTVDFDESQVRVKAASVLDYALGKMLTIDARTQAAAAGRGSGLSLRRRHLSTNSASSSSSSPCPPPSISNPTTSGGGGGGSSKYYRNNIYEKEQQRMMARSGRMMRLANAAFKRVLRSSPLDDDARVCAAETLSQALEMEGKFDSADRILLLDTVPSLVSNSAKIKCLEHVADMFKHRLLSSPHLEATGGASSSDSLERAFRAAAAINQALEKRRAKRRRQQQCPADKSGSAKTAVENINIATNANSSLRGWEAACKYLSSIREKRRRWDKELDAAIVNRRDERQLVEQYRGWVRARSPLVLLLAEAPKTTESGGASVGSGSIISNHLFMLHSAILGRNPALVSLLIATGKADPNIAFGRRLLRPLHLAVPDQEIMMTLISHNASLDALDSFRRTPLHHIAANWGMLSVVGKRRRRKEAEEEEAAAAESHTDHDGGKEEEIGDDGLSDLSWLWQLSSPRTINAPDYQGNSALHLLVMSSSHLKAPPLRTAQALLEANADPFLRNMAGDTPLHTAAHKGALDMVKCFLGHHRHRRRRRRSSNDEKTTRAAAATSSSIPMTMMMPGSCGLSIMNERGHTWLEYAKGKARQWALNDAGVFSDAVEEAVQNRNDRALRFLMKSEARISPKSSESSSMAMTRGLVHAARYDNEELGEWLLTHNADPNRTDDIKGGLCPLEVAVSQQCFKMTATLLEARADASIEVSKARGGGTLLHLAMQMDESEDLYSIISPTTRIVGMLLTARVDPNRQNAAGQTPLHLAAAFARHSGSLFVKRLVDAKASVSIEDRQGRRPIDCLGQRLDAAQTEQDGAHYDAQQRHVVAHGNKRKERSYVKRIRQLLSGADTSPRDTNKRPADDS